MRPAAFLDRDGTINVDVNYLSGPNEIELVPGAAQAIRALNDAGWLAIVVTNQSGVGRGYFDEATLARVHERLIEKLAVEQARLDAIYYCPHLPMNGCNCRKPAIGMIDRARKDHAIAVDRSWVIGDRLADIQLGRQAGCRTALVLTGNGAVDRDNVGPVDLIAPDLREAVRAILGLKD